MNKQKTKSREKRTLKQLEIAKDSVYIDQRQRRRAIKNVKRRLSKMCRRHSKQELRDYLDNT